MPRYRVTKSFYVYADSDEEVKQICYSDIMREERKGDTHPNLISIEEIPFGTMECREVKII